MAFCPNCGAPLEGNGTNCNYCGWQSASGAVVTSTTSGEAIESETSVSDTDLQSAYISGKAANFSSDSSLDYYLRTFKAFDLNGTPTFKWKWSWSEFLLGGWHLMYRRNYLAGIIAIVIFTVLPGWGFLLSIALGGCGNYLMYRRYVSKLSEFQSAYPKNKQKQMELLAEIGGTSGWVKVLIGLYILAYVIIGIAIFGLAAIGLSGY